MCHLEDHKVDWSKPVPKDNDAAAKLLAEWIGYSWDGIREERIVGYPQWARNGAGSLHFQGGRQDLRDLAEKLVNAACGDITSSEQK